MYYTILLSACIFCIIYCILCDDINTCILDDHSRVKLQKGEEDYINACYLPVPEANRNYILAQVIYMNSSIYLSMVDESTEKHFAANYQV